LNPLRIVAPELERLHAHAAEGYPHEVVGILAGRRGEHRVSRVHPLINERADSPANRYQVSALALAKAERALEAEGLEIVGYYHSHPDHPAQYSEFDRDHALPNMSYLITAVHGGRIADTRSWRLDEDRAAMTEEPVSAEGV
jgi:proteasome lid subunit RPN8/RPN11